MEDHPHPLELSKKVFIVGIKGVAMAGIAQILKKMGMQVSGSDTSEHQITDMQVGEAHIPVFTLQDDLPQDIDTIIYSAAHGGSVSSQVRQAQERGLMVYHQAQIIQLISELFPVRAAICGCHGKTSTTSLAVFALLELGARVSWLVGAPTFGGVSATGEPIQYAGAHLDPESSIFVYECDEYGVCPPIDLTPKLEFYRPTHIICTNIDFDHPDVYRDISHTREVFHRFFAKADFVFECQSTSLVGNRTGIVALVKELSLDHHRLEGIFARFTGVKRRLESYGIHDGIEYYDDYGHHPAEIIATVSALRTMRPEGRLIVLFQSHTYSRTIALRDEFVKALAHADIVLIDEIFPSAREPADAPKITAHELEVRAQAFGYDRIFGFASRDELVTQAKKLIKPGDVVLTLGAGDIYKVIPELIA